MLKVTVDDCLTILGYSAYPGLMQDRMEESCSPDGGQEAQRQDEMEVQHIVQSHVHSDLKPSKLGLLVLQNVSCFMWLLHIIKLFLVQLQWVFVFSDIFAIILLAFYCAVGAHMWFLFCFWAFIPRNSAFFQISHFLFYPQCMCACFCMHTQAYVPMCLLFQVFFSIIL